MNRISMLDPIKENEGIFEAAEASFSTLLRSGKYILGQEVEEFEKACASYLEVEHAIGMSSGTDALLAVLMALNIGPGDEVICPSFTFFATAGAISRVGATPVFADVYPGSFNLSVESTRALITDRTKAIMPVHLFGQSADMEGFQELAKAHSLFLIEDAAQAIGTRFRGQNVGTIGTVGCFSFFPSKNLGGIGDSGLVVTNDKELADKIKMIRNHGSKVRYHHEVIGANFRIDTVQAAFLKHKLPLLPKLQEQRCLNAATYAEHLQDHTDLVLPRLVHEGHSWNQFTIRTKARDQLKVHLDKAGIDSMIYYPVPVHAQPCYSSNSQLPVTDKLATEVLSLPIGPHLNTDAIRIVASEVNLFFAQQASVIE